ncbi:hypothetical protein GCK32_016449, partial [Trichostrongylus colubriformis]
MGIPSGSVNPTICKAWNRMNPFFTFKHPISTVRVPYTACPRNANMVTIIHVLTARARGVKTHEPSAPKRRFSDDDVITNDQHLREYFKEKYGIQLPTEASDLTSEERETLRALKKVLSENKESAIDKGVFRTMDSLKSKMKSSRTHHRAPSKETPPKLSTGSCPQCVFHNITMMRGAWTQMYGNPSVIRKTFGAIMSLEYARSTNGKTTFTSRKTACVGLE